MLTAKERFKRRQLRVRKKVFGTSTVPRVCLKKSLRYLYAQAIDDTTSRTLVSATTLSKEFEDPSQPSKSRKNIAFAIKLGESFGKKLLAANIKKIVFDRRGYKYHGVVKAFADQLRKVGVEF